MLRLRQAREGVILKRLAYISVLFLAAVVIGCATEQDSSSAKGETDYAKIFRGRWWSYYDRGSFYLEKKQFELAAADFSAALTGRSTDTWRARTYGLHFVEYFPNRELGIAYYEAGKLEEAQPLLEKSLQEVDTVRARHYLDLVKETKISKGVIQDTTAPAIEVNFLPPTILASRDLSAPPAPKAQEPAPKPAAQAEAKPAPKPEAKPAAQAEAKPDPKPEAKPVAQAEAKPAVKEAAKPAPKPEAKPAPKELPKVAAPEAPKPAPAEPLKQGTILATNTLPLEVKAKDDNGVKEIKVNDQPLYQRGSEVDLAKQPEIKLNEGVQEIKVAAKDLAGKETVETKQITVDLTGPTIGVYTPVEPTVTEEGTVLLEGASVDQFMVSSVNVDKQSLAESPGAPRLDFNSELPLGDGENSFVVASKDVAGNETRSAVKVFKGDPDSVEAKMWLLEQKFPERLHLAMTGAVALDILLSQTPEPVAVNEIRVKSPDPGKPYRNNSTLRISGEVVTQTKVASLSINGQPYEALTGAPKESFNKRIPLEQAQAGADGKLKVSISAQETGGATLNKEIEVDVQPVLVEREETKMPVAVMAFQGGEQLADMAGSIRAKTEGSLFDRRRFRVMERAALQDVLTEQQLSAALADPNEALNLGKLIPAQMFLVGEVISRGEKGVEVMVRAVSTETNEVIERVDGFVDDRSDAAALDTLCNSLATELVDKFPRRTGEILAVAEKNNEKLLLLDWSAEDNVRPGTRVVILRPEEDPFADPATQEEVSPADYAEAARARIRQLRSNGAEAVIEKTTEEGATLEKGMLAITM